ncbi:MAG: hypothetical protein ACM3ON_12895 [Chloroflexota bacterium]
MTVSFREGADIKSLPKCYIVRIYHCGSNDSRGLVGTVEEPESSAMRPFKSFTELWEIIKPRTPGGAGNSAKGGVSKKEATADKAPARRLNQTGVVMSRIPRSKKGGVTH